MAERQQHEPQHATDPQLQSPPASKEDMISYVMALEAALLPCLPARELQAIDRSPHPSHQTKKLQLYFIGLQREDRPTREEALQKEIAMMEEELKVKTELINKQEKLIQGWRTELKDQLDKHKLSWKELVRFSAVDMLFNIEDRYVYTLGLNIRMIWGIQLAFGKC
ncbi:Mediator of RNA polymerase II transcription subunit [Sesamum angolense]|uniref:Mediator of RNA polymerase II transcription subunit n=1 Tax=Sesamum angolense TaxID=2727404 RepID=A0AAE2C2T7_9LAMI|nr:Mediator of RNA polymerase II transcription subunit [Sesamum angolense]